eukprot:3346400-Amphidinium_carterae.1
MCPRRSPKLLHLSSISWRNPNAGAVRRPTDVQNHNKDFPLAPSPWADTSEFDRIMLKLDDTEVWQEEPRRLQA